MDTVPAQCKEEPFVHALDVELLGNSSNCCTKCLIEKPHGVSYFYCNGCFQYMYCSKECRNNDFPEHELECERLQRLARWRADSSPECTWPSFSEMLIASRGNKWWKWPDEFMRLFGRLEWKLSQKQFKNFKSRGRGYEDLKDNVDKMKQCQEAMQIFEDFFQQYARYVNKSPRQLDKDKMILMYSRLKSNVFPITNSQLRVIGLGLYLSLSRISHSCKPSARLMYNQTRVTAIPVVNNKFDSPFSWASVTISYVDDMSIRAERQALLRDKYFIDCKCSACLDRSRERDMFAFVCWDKRCKGRALPSYDDGIVKCLKCSKEIPTDELREKFTSAMEALERLEKTLEDGEVANDDKLALGRDTIDEMERVLYKHNIFLMKAWRLTFDYGYTMGRFSRAYKKITTAGRKLGEAYKVYLGKYDPLLLVCFWRVAQAYYEARPRDEEGAAELLFNSYLKYEHIYGQGHPALSEVGKLISDVDLS